MNLFFLDSVSFVFDNLNFDLTKFARLDLEHVDLDKFECIKLAYKAIK